MSGPARPPVRSPKLPQPRGEVSAAVIDALRGRPGPLALPSVVTDDPLADDDLHLALYIAYELHYRSFAGVDDGWEWEPSLLALRRTLETAFEAALRDALPPLDAGSVTDTLTKLSVTATGPSLSRYVRDQGTLDEVREFGVHRSLYQLKEADPHTWGIPRLSGAAKAAMVHIQYGEYGDGDPTAMHCVLFANTMRVLGLDETYGAYLDVVPGTTLATVNLMSLFGLHRRFRGALVGHLALFEMTSVGPMGRYADAMRRLGLDDAASRFYAVHVEADADHEVVAVKMADAAVAAEPELADDVVFGARALMHVEERFTRLLLDSWEHGRSSLLAPFPSALESCS